MLDTCLRVAGFLALSWPDGAPNVPPALPTRVDIVSSVIKDNIAESGTGASGGALYVQQALAQMTVSNSTVAGNTARSIQPGCVTQAMAHNRHTTHVLQLTEDVTHRKAGHSITSVSVCRVARASTLSMQM